MSVTGSSQYYGGFAKSGGAIGGFKGLEKYHEKQLSAEKELLIRNIAEDLRSSLKIPVKKSDPIEKIVSILKSKVPDGKNTGIAKNSSAHRAICKAWAKAINNRYPGKVIDEDDHENICSKTNELMGALFSGLQSEFLAVTTDIKQSLANLAIEKGYVMDSSVHILNDGSILNL